MSSRTLAADEFGVIQERMREIQKERAHNVLGDAVAAANPDIECFYSVARRCWWHRGVTERGRSALASVWTPSANAPDWYGCGSRYDEFYSDSDLVIRILPI